MDIEPDDNWRANELLTIEEVAALLKVPKSWIYERTRHGLIPHLKLGKYLRFPVKALFEWLATQDPTASGVTDLPSLSADTKARRTNPKPRATSQNKSRSSRPWGCSRIIRRDFSPALALTAVGESSQPALSVHPKKSARSFLYAHENF